VFGANQEDDAFMIVSVTEDLINKGVKADDLIKKIMPLFGGSGGGRPNMAQAGSKDPARLREVFDRVKVTVKESMGV
jgi:alanyl-tRNA synthetase